MLKAKFFHANAIDKMPKVTEQMNEFLGTMNQEDIVTVNMTEIGSPDKDLAYSFTVLVIYNSK